MAEEVVPIDSFEVLAAGAEKFVTGWEKTRYCVPAQPGSIDTALHQAVSAATSHCAVVTSCSAKATARSARGSSVCRNLAR